MKIIKILFFQCLELAVLAGFMSTPLTNPFVILVQTLSFIRTDL